MLVEGWLFLLGNTVQMSVPCDLSLFMFSLTMHFLILPVSVCVLVAVG